MKKIKLMLVDDHQIVREGIKELLFEEQDIEVACEASNGRQALDQLSTAMPDVVLTDITMPELDGFELATQLQADYPEIKVLYLSMHVTEVYIKKAFACGATGYLPKDISRTELVHAIRTVSEGKKYFNNEVSIILMNTMVDNLKKVQRNPTKSSSDLSEREIQIVKLLAEGLNSHEIGEMLFISKKTVDNHRLNILQKLNVKNVAGLIKYSIINKLI
jgi:DNA-binding NarL/FixJ family response regulator